MKKVYLDYAATTPLDPEVLRVMEPYLSTHFGNPSSIHAWGRETRLAVEKARQQVADFLGCQVEEIVFTGSITEAENLALIGFVQGLRDHHPDRQPSDFHLITSPVEHHAALDVFKAFEKQGFQVTYLPVDSTGLVSMEDVQQALTDQTVLVNVMYVNNEVGTVQPIAEIGEWVKSVRSRRGSADLPIAFHTDAAQAVEYFPMRVDDLGVDLMSFGPHKLYGPKGVGILYLREKTELSALVVGGGQEWGLRAGTENVPGIVGAGEAVARLSEPGGQSARILELQRRLVSGVLERVEDSCLTGHPEKRSPAIASFVIPGVEGEALLLMLDKAGIAASSGSACTTGDLKPSHVLLAMGIPAEEAHGSLRLSLGRQTTEEDIEYVLDALPEVVEKLRHRAESL